MFVEMYLLFSTVQKLPPPIVKWVASVFMPLLAVCGSYLCCFKVFFKAPVLVHIYILE